MREANENSTPKGKVNKTKTGEVTMTSPRQEGKEDFQISKYRKEKYQRYNKYPLNSHGTWFLFYPSRNLWNSRLQN